MNDTEYNEYLIELANLDGPALYVEQHFEGIDAELESFYKGGWS